MTKKKPKVSVLTPIYNTNPDHLRECIESILNQTFSDFEFIILNDSPDNLEIEKIVLSYKDKRIKYLKNEKKIGITKSRKKLLDCSCGEYIAIFDHDDISLPMRLETEVNYLDKHPNIGVVSCNTQWFPANNQTNHPVDNLAIKITLTHSNVVAHTAMMIRRSVLDYSNIRYEEEYSPAEDYMLCIRLMEYTMFHNIPDVLLKYRFTDDNTTNKIWDKMINADAMCRCVAMARYPYLYKLSQSGDAKHHMWIRLLGFIPFIKIRKNGAKVKYSLFGLFPLFYIKG